MFALRARKASRSWASLPIREADGEIVVSLSALKVKPRANGCSMTGDEYEHMIYYR